MKSKLKGIQEQTHRTGTSEIISKWKGKKTILTERNEGRNSTSSQDGPIRIRFTLLSETNKKLSKMHETTILKVLATRR